MIRWARSRSSIDLDLGALAQSREGALGRRAKRVGEDPGARRDREPGGDDGDPAGHARVSVVSTSSTDESASTDEPASTDEAPSADDRAASTNDAWVGASGT